MEGLKNIMEDTVEHQLDKLLPTMPEVCTCENCRLDMMSYALNRLTPQYVRTDTGALYQKLHNYQTQAEVEIMATVMAAITKIGSHPQHEQKPDNDT